MSERNDGASAIIGRTAVLHALAAVMLLFAVASCTGSREAEGVTPEMGEVSPGEALIVGTVLRVDTLRAKRATDPCSRNPCYATVRIDTVLAYGSGFPRPLSAGEHLDARFAFTLAPTEGVLPELTEPFPGMDAGDSFQAKLRAAVVPVTGSTEPMFVIFAYYLR